MCENANSPMIRVAGVVNDSITDGPGLRYTLFVQGCPHHCPGCHNPQTHSFEGGTLRRAEEIGAEVLKNPILSGLTLSGGEPVCQAAALVPLCQIVKQAGLDIVLYSGYTFEQLLEMKQKDVRQLLSLCDVLVDGPFLLEQKSLALLFRGSKNQRILNLPKSLKEGRAVEEKSERWREQ